jgi:ribonuclease HI
MGKKQYAVKIGRKPGIYREWYGENGAEAQVKGYFGAVYKGFGTLEDAQNWLKDRQASPNQPRMMLNSEDVKPEDQDQRDRVIDPAQVRTQSKVVIYTDGACTGNPGPGGYGVVLLNGKQRREFSAGYRRTTNNRMELLACIVGLEARKKPSQVVLYSDSRYVVNGMQRGWAKRWRRNGWMLGSKNAAKNTDLWTRLLDLCEKHQVEFVWVKGHAGDPENERCDQLSTRAANNRAFLPDPEVDTAETSFSGLPLFKKK